MTGIGTKSRPKKSLREAVDESPRAKAVEAALRALPLRQDINCDELDRQIERRALYIVHFHPGGRFIGKADRQRQAEAARALAPLVKLLADTAAELESKASILEVDNHRSSLAMQLTEALDALGGKTVSGLAQSFTRASAALGAIKLPNVRPRETGTQHIAEMAKNAFEQLTGKRPATSTNGGQKAGEFIKLLAGLYSALGVQASPASTANAVLYGSGKQKSTSKSED